MLIPGMTSVTFRSLSPAEIVKMAQNAGLKAIEWGGDIHVPHGDENKAREVYELTTDAGLVVSSYGSYYEAGVYNPKLPFEKVLSSAVALKTSMIRIWAGNRSSADSDEKWRGNVIEDCHKIAAQASAEKISISFEYHENTLTDTSESCHKLMNALSSDHFGCYWQIPMGSTISAALPMLKDVQPWLTNLHVFYYEGSEQSALSEGRGGWQQIISLVKEFGGNHFCLLEFVKNESVIQFCKDAEELKKLCLGETK